MLHALKGSSGYLGMTQVFELSTRLEKEIKQTKVVDEKGVKLISELLELSVDDAKAILSLNSDERAQSEMTVFTRNLSDISSELLSKLSASEYISPEILDEFLAVAEQSGKRKMATEIVSFIDSFDYEKAIKILTAGTV